MWVFHLVFVIYSDWCVVDYCDIVCCCLLKSGWRRHSKISAYFCSCRSIFFFLSRLQVMISWQHSCPQRLWSVCWAPRITTTEPVICKSLWFTDYPLNLRNLIGWEFKASTESCACSVNQIRPEVMILGADQKECMLWGQECSDSGDDCFFYRQVVKRSILPLVWFIIPYQIMSTVKLNHNWHLITTLSIVVFDWVL